MPAKETWMAHVTFFTKLGCMTAAKQIELLQKSGHEVDVRDLLAQPWTAEGLISYLGEMPVEEWFNPNSPRVKSGEIDPQAYDREGALSIMLADHLLIRRPLMESGDARLCGFDPVIVHAWVGLGATVYERSTKEAYTNCSQLTTTKQQCP
jgi:nitrogenase-associated protein